MTATVAPVRTNGHRRPVLIQVPRNEIVGHVLDWQALAEEAITSNGYSLQTVMRLPAGPWRQELQAAHIATHDRLVALLADLRMAAGRFDGSTPRIGA